MKQNIVRNQNGLLSAINLAIAGYTKHAAVIVLAVNHGAALALSRTQAIAARDAYDNGKGDLRDYRLLLNAKALETRQFSMLAKDILRPALGRKYSANWIGTGFTGSLEVPYKPDELEPMVESLDSFLTANPDKESASSNITALKANELYLALYGARSAVIGQEAANRTLLENQNSKFDTISKRLRGMVKELSQVLPPLDSRWLDYGFQIPGLQETPDRPGKITAILLGNNAVAVKWQAAARAEYYRVWVKVNGVDQDLRVVGSPLDLDFTIEGLPLNAVVQIGVSAINNGGESAVSELVPVTIV